jgi:hypothetical protein
VYVYLLGVSEVAFLGSCVANASEAWMPIESIDACRQLSVSVSVCVEWSAKVLSRSRGPNSAPTLSDRRHLPIESELSSPQTIHSYKNAPTGPWCVTLRHGIVHKLDQKPPVPLTRAMAP